MWGFILELFPTFLHRIGLKFPIHLNSDKSLELTKTRRPFPDGKGVDRAREKGRLMFPLPLLQKRRLQCPFGAAAPVFAGKALRAEIEAFLPHTRL